MDSSPASTVSHTAAILSSRMRRVSGHDRISDRWPRSSLSGISHRESKWSSLERNMRFLSEVFPARAGKMRKRGSIGDAT